MQVSPLPDSLDAPNATQISFLGAPVPALADISVSGSRTGNHPGRLEAYSQGDGASFMPSKPFHQGETVTVRGKVTPQRQDRALCIPLRDRVENPLARPASAPNAAAKHGELDVLPFATGPARADDRQSAPTHRQQSPGDIFVAPYSGPGPPGPMIFDSNGNLVWFDQLPADTEATNLQVQTYEGKPVLTWWQGHIPPQGFGEGEEFVDNSSYQTILHILRRQRHARRPARVPHRRPTTPPLLTVFDPIHCNLSSVGGPADGAVTDSLFQELDLKTHLVRREWHPVDHVPLSHSFEPANRAEHSGHMTTSTSTRSTRVRTARSCSPRATPRRCT